MADLQPLNLLHVHKSNIIINRAHTLLHSIAIAFLIYYRVSFLFQNDKETRSKPTWPWLLVFFSELLLSFIWLLGQAFKWRRVSRTVFPERLPEDDKLPAIDIFICTVDPNREPTIGVMNTVISALSLDYPPEKLHVYLSDDGGSSLTLKGMREAWEFAKWWIPFCNKFRIQDRCPEAYFSAISLADDVGGNSDEFLKQREIIKQKYQEFKERVNGLKEILGDACSASGDHPPVVEVIEGNPHDSKAQVLEQPILPLLVYVSREKRPSQPQHFKAGALNALLRVSGVISNSPYILMLDCDMYCNDPTSARQAMCFHLDPKLSSSLAFVQFPQRFHNIATNDIYDCQYRSTYTVLWQGMDGLEGPVLSGTGFYIKRVCFYGDYVQEGTDLMELKSYFGPSNEFMKSILHYNKPNLINNRESTNSLIKEAKFLASSTYADQTKWGKDVGFLYYAVAEDYLTGFTLQCKGWTSVFHATSMPQFLGTATTNLNDLLTQGIRWSSGLMDVGLSKFCPFIYGPSKMSFHGKMCYAELSFFPLYCLPLWCFATVPQLCLLNGTSIYPEVSNPFFIIFPFIFMSSSIKLLYEIFITGGSYRSWINEQRIWMIKSITSHLYGCLDAFMKRIGMRKTSFLATNKVDDDEQVMLYKKGLIDFRTSAMFLAPLVTLMMLNMVSFVVGMARLILVGDLEKWFLQVSISFYILVMSYPIMEGILIRKDKGRIPPSITIFSASVTLPLIFLPLGSRFLMY
ncbi:hypothetical protein FEM48_Zijuj07G0108000 [Ziziphus jujuba var. spinosa]|uniref:Cellulose synthase-like protein G2 n=1 Tax=Ziziphus jujuba var. spinosa TaxID=714518 RepID=A0A978V469_ZIZJJ|nr:hypothetical protein FEM48_Zijuj07G0108000 [Ziziphus jujuba var. spinosa]